MRRSAALLLLPLLAACNEYEINEFETVDVFHQNPAEEIDILMVVDNSCSMGPYQQKLGVNFQEFITFFVDANIDYHIGVTTTTLVIPEPAPDYGCPASEMAKIPLAGHLVDNIIIKPDTADAADVFNDIVNVGTCGAGFEAGLEAARIALDDTQITGPNYGFLRDDAALSIIFVSDEEDGSPDPVNTYINDFYEVKGQRSRSVFNASSLAVTDTGPCTTQQAASSTLGTRYIDVASQTAGVLGNLCDDDFETIVTDLSLNASRLRDTFFLSDWPAASTLQVSVGDDVLPCEDGSWTYVILPHEETQEDAPAIVFEREAMPPPGSQIAVRFNDGDGDVSLFCQDAGGGE